MENGVVRMGSKHVDIGLDSIGQLPGLPIRFEVFIGRADRATDRIAGRMGHIGISHIDSSALPP